MTQQKKRRKRDVNQIIITCFLVLLVGTLAFLGFKMMHQSTILATNEAIADGREAFVDGKYKEALTFFVKATDSLHFESEEMKLNTGHAVFHLSGTGTSKESKSIREIITNKIDSLDNAKVRADLDTYSTLAATAKNNEVASIAYNQIGVITYRSSKPDVNDTILENSLQYFKVALQKDPNNETARYNYELLQKKILYPETVMKRVRALVKESRYVEAHNILDAAAKKDPRIEQRNPEFLKRLKDIIKIDNL